MKKLLRILFIFSICFFAMECKKSSQEDVVIGVFTSLTGQTATFGQSMNNGIQLAVEEINADGGVLDKPVRTIVEDNQSKSEEAKTSVIKLIQKDNVVALLGEVASARSLAAAPVAQKNKVPMLTPASTNPQVTKVGNYIFRSCFVDDYQGAAMARFAYNDLGLRKVAIFYDAKNDYSVGLFEVFKKSFEGLGGKIVIEQSYFEGDIEFRAPLTAMKALNPDGIYIPGYYTEVGLIARQARELGITVPLLGGDGWDSPKTIEIGGSAVSGSYFSNHYAADDPTPKVQNFIKKYQEKYGQVPDAMAVLGYDAAYMLADAIKRAGSVDREKIRKALAETKNFDGVSGNITMDENRNASKSIVILKVNGKEVKFHKRLPPA
ncbi:MAG: ABC transporter substrate-binding protein [Deltaproteobacteria bacterium]|nr:ABC transporter substrate-binding protein [Deltaproteobacteria bacterium]